jgi:Putative Actinobacterial Holin-X, holin superfamily III
MADPTDMRREGEAVRTTTGRIRLDGPAPAEAATARAAVGAAGDDRSVGGLLKELAREGGTLVREEVALAKAEMREKASVYERNAGAIALGAGLLLAALLLAAEALTRGLTVLLEGLVGLEIAVWLAPLLLAAALFAVGYGMVKKGAAALRTEGVVPHRTLESIQEDKEWVERKVKS